MGLTLVNLSGTPLVFSLLKCHAFYICLNLALGIVFAKHGFSMHGYVVQYSSLMSFLSCL